MCFEINITYNFYKISPFHDENPQGYFRIRNWSFGYFYKTIKSYQLQVAEHLIWRPIASQNFRSNLSSANNSVTEYIPKITSSFAKPIFGDYFEENTIVQSSR